MDDLDDIFKEYPNKWIPNVLFLGPGGVKGYQIIGALIKFYPTYLVELDTIIGCSVGSIIGMMLCLGYEPREIAKKGKEFSIFDFFQFTSFQDILNKKGLIDPNRIKEKLIEIVAAKAVSNVTLKDLYNICGVEFISVISYKDESRAEYASYKNFPNALVTDIVFQSMNLPFIFHKDMFNGRVCVDGAFTDPLPLHLRDFGDNRILSISVDSEDSIDDDSNNEISMLKYIYQVMILPIVSLKKISIKNASSRCKILDMKCKVTDMSGATVKQDDKIAMLKDGFEGAENLLNKLINQEDNFVSKENNICKFEVVTKESVVMEESPKPKKNIIITKPNFNKKKKVSNPIPQVDTDFLIIEKTQQNEEIFDDVINKS